MMRYDPVLTRRIKTTFVVSECIDYVSKRT